MKDILAGIFAGVVLCSLSLSQGAIQAPSSATAHGDPAQATPSTQQAAQPPASRPQSGQGQTGALRIAPGSIIPVKLTKTIDSKKVTIGNEIEAQVTDDLKTGNGEVVLPKDTKIMGHVTEAQARTKQQKESQVGLAFDRAVMKNGTDISLPVTIQAIIAPPSLSTSNETGTENSGPMGSGQSMGGSRSGNMGERPGMGTGASSPTASSSSSAGGWPTGAQDGTNAHQPITTKTQGIVGISNLKLETAANATEGSIIGSDKTNVKLESGTLMLLRVTP